MKSFFKKFLRLKKIFIVFLTINLLLISSGFAQFNFSSAFQLDTLSSSPSSETASTSSALVQNSPSPTPTTPSLPQSGLARPAGEKLKKFDTTGKYVVDEVVVKFKAGVAESEKFSVAAENGTDIDKDLPYSKLKILKVDPAKRENVIEKLKSNPKVEYAGPNYAAFPSAACVPYPNDPDCSNQWNLNKISALPAWNGYKGSSNNMVAVVDTGINYNLPEFGLSGIGGRVIKGRDTFNNDNDPMDDHGHGTMVAGILGAKTNNGIDVAGVDWAAQIIAVKIAGSDGGGGTAELAEGLQYLVDAISPTVLKVVNISYVVFSDDPNITSAVAALINRGILVVVGVPNSPAGNWNCDAMPLAKLPGIIAVVGTDENDAHATGCTNGIQGFLMSAPSRNIWTENALGGTILVPGSWTSFATPQVSGAASVLFSCPGNPVLGTVRVALIAGSTDIGMAGYDSVYGYGRLNMHKAMLTLNNCVTDTDGDSYADYLENYVGTNPNAKCGLNAWPPDLNNDGKASLADVLSFIPYFNLSVGTDLVKRRYDLNGDGMVAMADILTFIPLFNKTCAAS